MKCDEKMIHALLMMGDVLLRSGAEIYRVEDTLNRLGRACGAREMNVFVITSSIVITMKNARGEIITQTRRVYHANENDFSRLTALNALSRSFCASPCPPEELEEKIRCIADQKVSPQVSLAGSILGSGAFAIFFGGNLPDALAASAAGILIWLMQQYLAPIFMNDVGFTFFASFLSGLVICSAGTVLPFIHTDMVMIGAIMLLIPGLMMTNSVRDILLGDTLSGIIRLIHALLLAGVLAIGIIAAIFLTRGWNL